MPSNNPSKLLILWTSGEKETALNMVFMYSINCLKHGWWDEVTLLVWGASSGLTSRDEDIQAKVAEAKTIGVRVIACKKCAENMGLVEKLEGLGIEVFYTGEFLSEWLHTENRVLSI